MGNLNGYDWRVLSLRWSIVVFRALAGVRKERTNEGEMRDM